MSTPDRPAYLPQLDGLRGLFMLLVVFAHLPRPSDAPFAALLWRGEHAVKLADVALDAFFVMSGFLITRLLLSERRRTGRISLRSFYLRRALRIFPIYYLAVIVVTLCWPTNGERTASLLLYVYNYYLPLNPTPYALEQSWSLAVEEQFYIGWPLLLIALPPRWLTRTTLLILPGIALLAAVALAALTPPAQAAAFIYMSLPTRMLPLALGCFLAVREAQGRPLRARTALTVAAVGALIVGGAVIGRDHGVVTAGGWYWTLILPGVTLVAFSIIALLIDPAAPKPLTAAFRHPVARFLGQISYASYLIHVPLLFALHINDAALGGGPAPWRRSAVVLLLTLALATLSLVAIERPLARLRSRFEPAPRALRPTQAAREVL